MVSFASANYQKRLLAAEAELRTYKQRTVEATPATTPSAATPIDLSQYSIQQEKLLSGLLSEIEQGQGLQIGLGQSSAQILSATARIDQAVEEMKKIGVELTTDPLRHQRILEILVETISTLKSINTTDCIIGNSGTLVDVAAIVAQQQSSQFELQGTLENVLKEQSLPNEVRSNLNKQLRDSTDRRKSLDFAVKSLKDMVSMNKNASPSNHLSQAISDLENKRIGLDQSSAAMQSFAKKYSSIERGFTGFEEMKRLVQKNGELINRLEKPLKQAKTYEASIAENSRRLLLACNGNQGR
jgi:hypothetical protein